MKADVVFTWFCESPELSATKALFQHPTVWIPMPAGFVTDPKTKKPKARDYDADLRALGPSPLRAKIHQFDPTIEPQRVALLGFSQGCQGPRSVLHLDGGANVDAVLAIDGIHTGYGPNKSLQTPQLAPWASYAKLARAGGHLLFVSTSSIVPGKFASTTETANWLWQSATGTDQDIQDEPLPPGFWNHEWQPPVTIKYQCVRPVTYHWSITYRYRRAGDFVVVNYGDLDPTGCADHIFQARQALPLTVANFLAPRWNATPPTPLGVAGIGSLASLSVVR